MDKIQTETDFFVGWLLLGALVYTVLPKALVKLKNLFVDNLSKKDIPQSKMTKFKNIARSQKAARVNLIGCGGVIFFNFLF